jgi:hypothetical protein
MSDLRSSRLSTLAWPPTCATYVHHLHWALRQLIDRAERFGAGLPGYPQEMGELELWSDVHELEDLRAIRIDIPTDTLYFPRLREAELWLRNIIADLRTFDRRSPPPMASEHARRLASPDYLRALRSILALIPDPFDCPQGESLALFEWARYHLGTNPREWIFDAKIPSDFRRRWTDAGWDYENHDRHPNERENCRRLLIECGLLCVDPPSPLAYQEQGRESLSLRLEMAKSLDQPAVVPKTPTDACESTVSELPEAPKRRRRNKGDALKLLDAALDSLIARGDWGKTDCEISDLAGISRSTFYRVAGKKGRNEDIKSKLRRYRQRSRGRGPARADEL